MAIKLSSHTVRFKNINIVASVIVFFIFCVDAPSYFDFSVRNLQNSLRKPDGIESKENFMLLVKHPVSMHIHTISKSLKCNPTSKIKIFPKRHGPWVLQTYTNDGMKKQKGGDEFYITYHDKNNAFQSPSAVAHIKDTRDGTYTLRFIRSRLEIVRNLPLVGKGTVTVFLPTHAV